MSTLGSLSDDLARIAADLAPSVVRVEARRRVPSSGIIWSADGVIVTAEHSVERDDGVRVGLHAGDEVSASVVGRDPTTDIAVLRVERGGLTPPAWSDETAAKVGQVVLALGRPGKTIRVRWGIISAVGETWRAPSGGELDRYLETDVGMAFGYSGGLLVDAAAGALGMNTAGLLRRTALAVPATTLRRVVETLLQHGRVRRGYLGIGAHPVRLPETLREQLGQRSGLIVISVEPGSPADRGGIVFGDVVVAIGGTAVRHMDDVLSRLGPESIGTAMAVRLIRGGDIKELSVTVAERT